MAKKRKCDVMLDWRGKEIEKVTMAASWNGLLSLAKLIRNRATDFSPYDTGHNAASTAVIQPDGKVTRKAGASTKRKGMVFVAGASYAEPNAIGIGSTSGYGGYLEAPSRPVTFKNGKFSRYLTRAFVATLFESGAVKAAMEQNIKLQRLKQGVE